MALRCPGRPAHPPPGGPARRLRPSARSGRCAAGTETRRAGRNQVPHGLRGPYGPRRPAEPRRARRGGCGDPPRKRAEPRRSGGLAALLAAACGVAALAAALAGCTRLGRLEDRLDAVEDDRARRLLRDAVWRHGSRYAWAEAGTLRAEVTWTEHRPLGDRSRRETWRVDPLTGRCRIEAPEAGDLIVYEPPDLTVLGHGEAVTDPLARARAAGRVRLAGDLLPMPVSLLREGRETIYAGDRLGPAETRRWERLMATDKPAAPGLAGNRMVVEMAAGSARVDRVLLTRSEPPFIGRPMRVEMDLWRPVGDLLVARRWRLVPIDAQGRPTGPVRYTLRVEAITTGAAASPPSHDGGSAQ